MDENTNTATPAEVEPTGLTIQDLNLVLQVIQVSATRGAFKAEELSMVGGLHDRIYKFLDAAGAFVKAPVNETPAPAVEKKVKPKKVKVE
jgi:hypothetical protein